MGGLAMFGDGSLTFWEFATCEPFPLAVVHDAILFEFLPGREDAVLMGAQAVNAYVEQARMTQDVDLASPRAQELSGELKEFLSKRFAIAVRVRPMSAGNGYRIEQMRKPKNRHLVDVRPIDALPPSQRVENVLVVAPAELICQKVLTMIRRTDRPKSYTDQADLYRLLLTFPQLKKEDGPVRERFRIARAPAMALETWKKLVAQEILPEDDADEFER
jgi:hypothetical protein